MGTVLANWKWLVSGFAFVVYVAIQHVLYVSLMAACHRFKRALDAAKEHPEETSGFVWLVNVRNMFTQANGTWIDNAPIPRDAVIDSLDNEIWRTSRYSALQRWGLAAPLLGVILSAFGFMVSPPQLTGEVQDVMSKLGPLFTGVFVGALMALVNQVYLHFAAIELSAVRAKAVLWFDEIVWKAISQNAHNALGQAASATQSAAAYLENSSHQLATSNIAYRDSLLELNRQLAQVREAAQATSATFNTFTTSFGEMTEQIRASIRNLTAINETANAVENSGAIWASAANKVSNASTAIEESSLKLAETSNNFSTNFEAMHQSLKDNLGASTSGLLAVVNNLTDPIQRLETSIQHMQENTDRHSELSAALSAAVKQSDQFLMERMALNADEADLQKEMASRVRLSIESMQKLTDTVGAVGNIGASLNQAAAGLNESAAAIGGAVKNFAELQATVHSSISETTSGLQNAARDLAHPIQSLHGSVERVSASTEGHADLSERIGNLTHQTERLIQDRVQASAEESQRMETVEKRLDETSHVLADSAARMQELQGGLEALVSELKLLRESNAGRGRWLSWLSKPNKSQNSLASPKNGH